MFVLSFYFQSYFSKLILNKLFEMISKYKNGSYMYVA